MFPSFSAQGRMLIEGCAPLTDHNFTTRLFLQRNKAIFINILGLWVFKAFFFSSLSLIIPLSLFILSNLLNPN